MNVSCLFIKLRAYAGSSIRDIVDQMADVANRLQIAVELDYSPDVTLHFYPGDNPKTLLDKFWGGSSKTQQMEFDFKSDESGQKRHRWLTSSPRPDPREDA